jgi:hypothetical protein
MEPERPRLASSPHRAHQTGAPKSVALDRPLGKESALHRVRLQRLSIAESGTAPPSYGSVIAKKWKSGIGT